MAANTLNLIYSQSQFPFFSKIRAIKAEVLNFKKNAAMIDFGTQDEVEVGRGVSYAVFPELRTLIENNSDINNSPKITVDALRNGLKQRGVSDVIMQNKVLSLLLQNRAGLQFAMGSILTTLFLDNGFQFVMNSNYKVNLEVKNKQVVKLIFQGNWHNILDESKESAIFADVEIDITPTKATISTFQLTNIAENEETNNAFDFLLANQASIIWKIIIFLKTWFNLNRDIEVENANQDKCAWGECANQNEPTSTPTELYSFSR